MMVGPSCDRCTLSKRIKRTMADGSVFHVDEIDLGYVSNISITSNVSLFEAPVFTLPSKNRYIVDTGCVTQINLDLIRPQPPDINDEVIDGIDAAPSERWSNSKWYSRFESMIDAWQNMTYNCTKGEDADRLTGGFVLNYISAPGTEELFPDLKNVNVFIKGSVDYKVDAGVISYSLTLVEGAMNYGAGTELPYSIQLEFLDPSTSEVLLTTQVYVGSSIQIPDFMDIKWYETYSAWSNAEWAGSTGYPINILAPNSIISWDNFHVDQAYLNDPNRTPMKFKPKPMKHIKQDVITTDTQINIPADADYAKYVLVGGGGAGAECEVGAPSVSYIPVPSYVGGGGGAGQVVRGDVSIQVGTSMDVKIGKGGVSGYAFQVRGSTLGRKSESGSPSVLSIGTTKVRAEGGGAGHGTLYYPKQVDLRKSCDGGTGAKGSGNGGRGSLTSNGWPSYQDQSPSDGTYGVEVIGVPGTATQYGAGGGAAPLGAGDVCTSIGGKAPSPNGGSYQSPKFNNYREGIDGKFGGGGASFNVTSSTHLNSDEGEIINTITVFRAGHGGDGVLIIDWYKRGV